MTTDFMENLLSSMSTAFNLTSTDGTQPIDIKDDKTLKWRALQNNQYARKLLKKGLNPTETLEICSEVGVSKIKLESELLKSTVKEGPNINANLEKGVDVKMKISDNFSEDKKEQEQSPSKKIRKSLECSEISSRRLRRCQPTEQCDGFMKILPNETEIIPPKRRGRSKKYTETKFDEPQTEDEKLMNKTLKRSDRTFIAQVKLENPIELAVTTSPTLKEKNQNEKKITENFQSDINLVQNCKFKKKRRSSRLERKGDIEETVETASSEIVKEEKTKSPTKLTVYDLVCDDKSEKLFNITKKHPKKRGRRSKITHKKNDNMSNSSLISIKEIQIMIPKKTNLKATTKEIVSSQRPLRRIKPTPKILENDELRYEFETKNIARITACTEFAISETEHEVFRQPVRIATKQETTISQQQISAQVDQKINKNTCGKNQSYSAFPPIRPCPDPVSFLNEIKASKLNLHKSPEDKKLNRKQHRKLLKQKVKHFQTLGLKSTFITEKSDSEASSGENEEFVPSKKINVGKPNVTLRIRPSNNKEDLIAISGGSKSSSFLVRSSETLQSKHKIKLNPQSEKNKTLSTTNLFQTKQFDMPINSSQSTTNESEKLLICLCRKPTHYYTRNTPDTAFCCAIDNIEEQKVGCSNQLPGELLNLLRPSQCVGYMILCKDHTKRMKAHNCCAGCGIFCTQGNFMLCQNEHFFHAECAQKFILNSPYDPENRTDYTSPTLVLKCPHCGQDTPEKTSIVTMKCQSVPVFLPSQKTLLKPAKVAVPDRQQLLQKMRKFPVCVELESLIPESVMNVVVREGNSEGSANEFTSKDMFYAVNNDDLERVAEILSSGYDITSEMPEFLNGTCLHLVAHFGTIQMAYLLLCRESSNDFLNMIDKELRTAIMCSIIGDKVDILKLFIQCGSNLNKKGPDGMTCLHIAAKVGNLQATQLIVESYKNSSNINSFQQFINSQDDGGWTAIVWAAELGFTEIVSLLLNNGAGPNICDAENNSVLHWATLSNHVETISVLLRSRIDCSIQNINGDTPLHIACRSSCTRICLMLIANGADLMVKNKAEELPYDCIANEESQCARAVGFNMQIRSFGPTGLRNKIINSDISNGREIHPIQVIKRYREERNTASEVDEIMVPDFKYITKSILLQNSIQMDYRVSQMRICACTDGCNSDQCQCSTISIQNWYTPEGRLNGEFNYEDPAMIFECNDVCGCNKLICKNRVVQNGLKISLQVFECKEFVKGWGVRTLTSIPRGTFIAEYTGEILTDLEADRRTDDSYFFDLGASEHCIDANFYGNISRFFNHSCSPNIVPVRVYYEHHDFRFPKIAFFASKEIPDGEELCFDYGDKFWSIKQKYFSCKCQLAKCRYSSLKPAHNSLLKNI